MGPLPVEALDRLLRERLGDAPSGSALLDLHVVSGGNALFALEIAQASMAAESDRAARALVVPRNLRVQVADRFAGLRPDVREVLIAAAAMGRPTVEFVGAVTGSGDEALRVAVGSGVLEIHGGSVRFSHPLYASVAYADARPEDRARIHRRLADVVADPEERAPPRAFGHGSRCDCGAVVGGRGSARSIPWCPDSRG